MEIEFPFGLARFELKSNVESAINDLTDILRAVAYRQDSEHRIRDFVAQHLELEGFEASIAANVIQGSTLVPPTSNLIVYEPEGSEGTGALRCIGKEALCFRGSKPLIVCSVSKRK
eukprot:Rmarinus@m.15729